MKRDKFIYWGATGVMCLVFLLSAGMYLFAYDRASGFFTNLGFPTWLIYPLAVLKILGVTAILTKKSDLLKQLAYAGFFFDVVLALSAHLVANDGAAILSVIALTATIVSWLFDRKYFPSTTLS